MYRRDRTGRMRMFNHNLLSQCGGMEQRPYDELSLPSDSDEEGGAPGVPARTQPNAPTPPEGVPPFGGVPATQQIWARGPFSTLPQPAPPRANLPPFLLPQRRK